MFAGPFESFKCHICSVLYIACSVNVYMKSEKKIKIHHCKLSNEIQNIGLLYRGVRVGSIGTCGPLGTTYCGESPVGGFLVTSFLDIMGIHTLFQHKHNNI